MTADADSKYMRSQPRKDKRTFRFGLSRFVIAGGPLPWPAKRQRGHLPLGPWVLDGPPGPAPAHGEP